MPTYLCPKCRKFHESEVENGDQFLLCGHCAFPPEFEEHGAQRYINIGGRHYPLTWRDDAYLQGGELHGGWCRASPLPDDVCEMLNCCMFEGLEHSGDIPAGYGDFAHEPWFLVRRATPER